MAGGMVIPQGDHVPTFPAVLRIQRRRLIGSRGSIGPGYRFRTLRSRLQHGTHQGTLSARGCKAPTLQLAALGMSQVQDGVALHRGFELAAGAAGNGVGLGGLARLGVEPLDVEFAAGGR